MLRVGPDGSRRIQTIVWMIIGMIKAHPTQHSDATASRVEGLTPPDAERLAP
jgi:hypothetical protein